MVDAGLIIPIVKETEIDFGSTPVAEKTFVITDSDVDTTKKISVSLSYAIPTGGVAGDAEAFMDVHFAAVAEAGQFTLYCWIPNRDVDGKCKINYTIG